MKIVAVLALAIFAVASANDNCNRECSFIIAPVCGYDPKTKSFKTFDNVCYLGQENCLKKTSYYKRFEGSCVQPKAQAAAAQPVNQDESEEEEENNNECPSSCPLIWGPVCGYDGKTGKYKTFANDCKLRSTNCKKGTSYVEKSKGSCAQPRAEAEAAQPINQDQSEEEENNGECPLSCPLIWGPVCGYDEKTGKYKTFANACKLRSTNCRKQTSYVEKSKGSCAQPRAEAEAAESENQDESEEQSNDCRLFCEKTKLLVCGYDDNTDTLKTFDNSCELESTNCRKGTGYVEISKGPCPKDE